MEEPNSFQIFLRELRELLEPLAQGIGDEGVRREILLALGLDPSGATTPLNIPPSSLQSIQSYQEQAAADADLKAFISTLQDITIIIQSLADFIQSVAATDADAPPGFLIDEVIGFFLNTQALGYLRVRSPAIYITVMALKLIEDQAIQFGGIVNLLFKTGDYFEELWGAAKALQTDGDAKTVSDVALFVPGVLISALLGGEIVYGYDAAVDPDAMPLADAVSNRTLTVRLTGKTKDTGDNTVKGGILLSAVLVPADHGGPGIVMRIQGDGSVEVPVNKNVSFKFSADAPDLIFYLGEGSHDFPSSTDASFGIALNYKSTAKKQIIWLNEEETHFQIGQMKVEGKVSTDDYMIKGETKENVLVITTDDSDGFLKTILDAVTSNGKLEAPFEFNIGYSKKKGFFVGGGAGLLMSIPLHKTLGPLKFNTVTAGLMLGERAGKEPGIKAEASLSFGIDLGVLQASVDRIGLAGFVAFDQDSDTKYSIDFKPPNGVALAIDAGSVRGGGFLYFDFERGEYAGGLELDISGILTVKAIGIISTHMPDGRDGFALLIIITAEFGSPIQLGLGFVLIGLGGLLGLNRTMRLEPLAEGIRTGSVNRIMFPQNIVANAAQIISDLRTFFPPENGTFLIGPMAKLGWGTPALVTLSIGVVIQIPPGNVAILGVLRLVLPDEDAAVLKLQVGFIGAIEVDKERVWFYAALFDSRILTMTIEGGMGLLVGWGNNANFVISVGGFHPQYEPPPLPFPVPPRLAINILNYPLARIRVMAYFAVTSNTVQFGAKAELFFGFDGLSIEGHLAFDALFQFSPFYFIIEISASISLKVFGAGLFSVRLRGSLEGPTPWRIAGAASVSILFFEISVDFEKTWGESVDTTLPDTAVMPLLAAELEKESNWKAELPPGSHLLVSLRELTDVVDTLVLHPVGQLRVSQRAVPLDIQVDKVGNQKAADAHKFHLKVSGAGLSKTAVSDKMFAIAQYQDIGDSQKLSLPAFQPEAGGIVLSAGGQQARSSRLFKRNVRYEKIIIDTNFKQFIELFFGFWISLFAHFFGGASVVQSELSHQKQQELRPFAEKIMVQETGYTVANVRDNTPFAADALKFGSEAQAREYMAQQIITDPNLARNLHVIPRYEVNTNV